MDTLKSLHFRLSRELDPIGRVHGGLSRYTDAAFPPDPTTALHIKSFVKDSGLYNSKSRKWTSLYRARTSLRDLCAQLAATIEAIIAYFEIPDRKVVCGEPPQQIGRLTMEPEIMVVGRGGTAFENDEFPEDMEYSACATPIAMRPRCSLSPKRLHAQMGVFAHNCIQAQYNRRFVCTMILEQGNLQLYQFDRSGCLFSNPLDIHKDPETFVRWLLAAASPDVTALGFDATVKWRDKKRVIQTLDEQYMPIELDLSPCQPIDQFTGLVGHGTVHWTAHKLFKSYFIKEKWRLVGAEREEEFLEKARGLDGVAQLVSHETGEVTASLWYNLTPSFFENRQFIRLTVTGPSGRSIEHFNSRIHLLSAFRDAVAGHRNLRRSRILHRNINIANIQLGCDGNGPGNRGVLIGLDKAKWLTRKKVNYPPPRIDENGPFTSLKILDAGYNHHDYLDDLQSFFYVLTWICIAYEGPGQKKSELPSMLQAWLQDDLDEHIKSKAEQHSSFDEYSALHVSPYFGEVFVHLLRDLQAIFWQLNPEESLPIPLPGSSYNAEEIYDRFLSAIDKALSALHSESSEDIKPTIPVASPSSNLISSKKRKRTPSEDSDDLPLKKPMPEHHAKRKRKAPIVDKVDTDDLPLKKRLRSACLNISNIPPVTTRSRSSKEFRRRK
ncbi:hypothetical protein AX16_006324 [Volvariella volvacea WC 439]|nr:hypothetical protein AX16_006324 [Volvariella volvacea WC 439]